MAVRCVYTLHIRLDCFEVCGRSQKRKHSVADRLHCALVGCLALRTAQPIIIIITEPYAHDQTVYIHIELAVISIEIVADFNAHGSTTQN